MIRHLRRLLRRNVDLQVRLAPYVDNGWPR